MLTSSKRLFFEAGLSNPAHFLEHILVDYWRWCAEDRPPYSTNASLHEQGHQSYYNPEEQSFVYLGQGRYRFVLEMAVHGQYRQFIGILRVAADAIMVENYYEIPRVMVKADKDFSP